EPINISTAVENQILCIINKNEICEVKTSNIEEKKTETTQELVITAQSAQVLKEDMSGTKKNREKP
ncbi:18167_t:CDS:1, partial [Gigaspora margarita]